MAEIYVPSENKTYESSESHIAEKSLGWVVVIHFRTVEAQRPYARVEGTYSSGKEARKRGEALRRQMLDEERLEKKTQ